VRPAFRGAPVHVRAPATSANLGPGFDTLGLALTLFDDVIARVADEGLVIDVAGEGVNLPRDENHLVVKAMRTTFDRLGGQPGGLELSCANRIPHGRGLGSSAAAIVAGVLLARTLVLGGERELPDHEALELACELEGHPDNVAACLLGGLTVAWIDSGADALPASGAREAPRAQAVRLEPASWLRPVALIPADQSPTHVARGLLPATVPHGDAAANAARSALLIAGLLGAADALWAATADRLHQPYRAPAMPATAALVETLRAAGRAAVVSGAGPTVLVLARDAAEAAAVRTQTPEDWQFVPLRVDTAGAHVVVGAR
jgi:homoserine kinase